MNRGPPNDETLERPGDAEEPKPARATPRDLTGTMLGPYRVGARLGAGGMGVVYEAVDTRLKRAVALKVLSERYAADERSAARLLREARAAAAFHHPSVVAIYDVDEQDGVAFISMELVAGRSLRAILDASALPPVATRLAWLRGVASALAAAHRAGIVHGDVKPENVMVRDEETVKVLDFSVARRLLETTVDPLGPTLVDAPTRTKATLDGANKLAGTPGYMAPEQLAGAGASAASDQFAWGVLAYEVLTGAHPWDPGANVAGEMARRVPPNVCTRAPEVPEKIADVVATALRAEPARRARSMEDVVDVLEREMRALAAEPPARPQAAPRSRARWVGAAIAFAGLGAAVAVAIVKPFARHDAAAPAASRPNAEALASRSSDHVAQAAFDAGMQALRDGALDAASAKLQDAAKLDPSFGGAYLWSVVAFRQLDDDVRDRLRIASSLRLTLTRRERAILDALEAWAALPRDDTTVEKRLASLLADDRAESALVACRLRFDINEHERAVEACRETARRDPSIAAPHLVEGMALGRLGDADGSEAAYRACIARAPNATGCLDQLAIVQAGAGNCEEVVDLCRRELAAGGDDARVHRSLAWALYASGAPVESYRDAISRSLERLPADKRASEEVFERFAFDVLEGDFDGAADALAEVERRIWSSPAERDHLRVFEGRDRLAIEVGSPTARVANARSYLAARAAWTPFPHFDESILANDALYVTGAMTKAQFESARAAWLARGGTMRGYEWVAAYGWPIRTRDDAVDALAALARFPLRAERSADEDYVIGRAYSLAGRTADAVPYLRRAAKTCFAGRLPFSTREAAQELAEALAATGDTPGACEAIAPLLRTWARHDCSTCRRAAAFARTHTCLR